MDADPKDSREALARVFRLVSIADVERGTSRARRTWESYRSGARRLTPEAARELGAFLRNRASALTAAAADLESAARSSEGER